MRSKINSSDSTLSLFAIAAVVTICRLAQPISSHKAETIATESSSYAPAKKSHESLAQAETGTLVLEAPSDLGKPTKSADEFKIELRPETLAWMNHLPAPRHFSENVFLQALGKIHESNEQPSPQEIEAFSAKFIREGEDLDVYLEDVLSRLEPARDQKERNFIFEFARQGRPETSMSDLVEKDLREARRAGQYVASEDQQKLLDIFMAQQDLSFEEKDEVLRSLGLPFPSAD